MALKINKIPIETMEIMYNWAMAQRKNLTQFLLSRYGKMSGSKKVRLGMELSEMVRKVRKAGKVATGN